MTTANQLSAQSIVEKINSGKLLDQDHIQDIICDIVSNEEDEEDTNEVDQVMKSLELVHKCRSNFKFPFCQPSPAGHTQINLNGGRSEVVIDSAASIADMIAAIAPRNR